MYISLTILTIILYLICGGILLLNLLNKLSSDSIGKQKLLSLAGVTVALHSFVLYSTLFTPTGIDIGFFNVLSIVAWLVSLLLTFAALSMAVECLGVLVYPFAALFLSTSLLSNESHLLPYTLSAGLLFHVMISILAYSLLSIAAVQAILLYVQDKQLHNKHPGGIIRSFPPLETMETLLFQVIIIGFIMLGVSLFSGIVYLEDIFAQHLVHKTTLSIIAWILFG
ncbi:MAG: cytochrome c biogenesis protein CcsA, partial [Gammaproteobacteria bacterium]|nr:cytochrome c biogenesis protein CcsA [Gammaproteobacteria bacterium]